MKQYNNPHHHSQQESHLQKKLNLPDFKTSSQPPNYLQAAYSSHLTSPYMGGLDLNQLSPADGEELLPSSARENLRFGLPSSSLTSQHPQTSVVQSISHRSSQSSSNQGASSLMDEQRRQEILQRLQLERESRRLLVQGAENSVSTAGFAGGQSRSVQVNEQRTPPSLSSQSSNQNAKNQIVHKLLNERRINRSGQQQSQPDMISQNNDDYQQTSARNDNASSFGGYNPEALYQEEALREQYSQQDRDRSETAERNEQVNMRVEDEEVDVKYRDAVAYAREQIERDRQKRLNQLNKKYQQPSHSSSRSRSNHNSSSEQVLPPALYNMERQIAKQSIQKQHFEMNNKVNKHHFTYESEDELHHNKQTSNRAASQEERGFKVEGNKIQKTGEYMKTTVNADLKKLGSEQTVPTIAKTKQIITEAEKKFKEEHTFKPQIKEYPHSKELSKEERWKKLTEPKTIENQKRERIRAQIEIEETQKTCPFKPNAQSTKNGRCSTAYKPNQYESLPLPERLLHEADLRKEKREKLKRDQDIELMKECSFKPRLLSDTATNSSDRFQNRDPIHERVQELQKEKNEKLQKLRIQSEKDQQDEFTFQPVVNKKSSKMAIIKQSADHQTSVVERLYRDANDRIEKNMSNNVSVNEQMNRDYSFHPQISKSSAYMSAQSDMYSGNMKDFQDRQEAYVKRKLENQVEARKKWADEERYSYHPEINATSEVICESDPIRGGENEQDRIHRLYNRDQKKQEVVRELIEKEVYAQYTYKPEINKVSKAIARNGQSIDELAYNPRGRERKELLQEQLMTQEFSNCTFQPETTKNRKYQNVASTYSMADCPSQEDYSKKLKENLKRKQERIAQDRREREYQQLKDCTFHPKILDKEPSTISSENVEVKGVARHMELKVLQKKIEEDKRLREAEVFGLNHKFAVHVDEAELQRLPIGKQGKTSCHSTIPQPFELTNAGKIDEKRRQQLLKQLKEKEMTECTFKPNTNEGRNKKIINELLLQMEDDASHHLRVPQQNDNNKENRIMHRNYSEHPMQQHSQMADGNGGHSISAYY